MALFPTDRRLSLRSAFALLAIGAALVLSCGEPAEQPSFDAGAEPDASLAEDSGSAGDAGGGIDDAGSGSDAGQPHDAGGGATDAGTRPDAGAPRDAGSGEPVLVRILAGNLTSGTAQSYDSGEGIRIFQGLQPDIALIQEFNYGDNSARDLRLFVDTAFGQEFEYYRESQAADSIPNGIVSRYPIIDSGEWSYADDRDLVWARIDVPGPVDLWAVSVHLLTGADPSGRTAGARTAVARLKELMAPGDLLAFGGDFNTAARDEYCITVLSELFHTAAPYPADQNGNNNTNITRRKPLDWLLVSPSLQAHHVPLVIGDNSFTNGLVFDSRVYTPLYDVEPVEKTDSEALNMQHMAVVRDFELVE